MEKKKIIGTLQQKFCTKGKSNLTCYCTDKRGAVEKMYQYRITAERNNSMTVGNLHSAEFLCFFNQSLFVGGVCRILECSSV